ncbi:caspase domain-containing protein [Streptomyces goshikiensis]|uniref:caspase family protein n=1 Tax=Streptomyces goshikiensis TaxID=1942 RepID=UPI003689D4B7
MRTVYAFFVGIDAYPVSPLTGCVNDVAAAEQWLRGQPDVWPSVLRLLDAQATRSALIDSIDNHLGRSGPGDTALLWFSGHGSERPTDNPFAPTGTSQALVCHDSLTNGGQPLLDSELGVMLDRIARKGVHVLAVLDCCHAGGATRSKDRSKSRGATVRAVEWKSWWQQETSGSHRTSVRPAPGAGARATAPSLAPEHVLVAACRPHEKAYEEIIEDESRGCFSHSLLDTLDRLGPAATYGAAHALVEERVRARQRGQHPVFRGPATERFLHGEKTDSSPFLLRYTTAGWEVDCGAAHGLRAAGAEFTLLEPDVPRPRVMTVREVRAETSIVDPVAWQPADKDTKTAHPVTPSALAFPAARVAVTGSADDVRLVRKAVAPSSLLTTSMQDPASTGRGLTLFVKADGGWAEVSGGAGHPITRLPLRTAADARHIADCCAHIARWHQLRDLTNPDSSLSSMVRVSVEPLVGGLRSTSTGDIVCSYTPDGREPQVRVRIHNHSGNRLWCVLLNLTDSYASSVNLFDGDFVGPGCAGTARRGEPVWLRLPPGREMVSGASTRDVLKVIVAEHPLNTEPFRLPAWPPELPGRGSVSPDSREDLHRVLRLTRGQRDMGGPPGTTIALWGTASVEIRTEVP